MMKRIMLYTTVILGAIIFMPMLKYIAAKVTNNNDCMITYIQNYFPEGTEYRVLTEYGWRNHIDKRDAFSDNETLYKKRDIERCNFWWSIFNTSYCMQTHVYERLFSK